MNRHRWKRNAGRIAGCVFSWLFVGEAAGASQRPNVLFILCDDLDFDAVGGLDPRQFPSRTGLDMSGFHPERRNNYGIYSKRPFTPHIDELMREGMTFTQFRMASTVCTPSRYSILTGQYPSRSETLALRYPPPETANVDFITHLRPGQWHLGRAFHEAGYATGIVGKWHLADDREEIGLIRPPMYYRGVETGPQDPSHPEVARRLSAAVAEAVDYLTTQMGFDYASSIYMINGNQIGLPRPLIELESNLEWQTAGALRFLDQFADPSASGGKPFFLYFSVTVPHGLFGPRFTRCDPRATPEGFTDWHLDAQPPRTGILDRLRARGLDSSAAVPMWLDDAVGAVLGRLEDLGVAENTIVVFSSDHQSYGKWTCYESARVPMMIRWPGTIEAGSESGQSFSGVDLVPTLLEACGIPLPTDVVLDGRSFLPIFSGGRVEERPVLIEMGYARAVVFNGWKYIARRQPGDFSDRGGLSRVRLHRGVPSDAAEVWPSYGETDELFDLVRDPFEQNNLAGNPEYAPKLGEMRSAMSQVIEMLPHRFGEF